MSKKRSYVAVFVGLGFLAVVVYYATRYRPRQGPELIRKVPFTKIQELTKAPFIGADFPNRPSISKASIVSGQYDIVTDVNLWPDILKKFYGIGTDSYMSGMANPGMAFNRTDVIESETLPSRRLIFAADCSREKLWIIHFEYGGIVHGYAAHFLTVSEDSVLPVWRCFVDEPAKDIPALLDKIRTGACNAPSQ